MLYAIQALIIYLYSIWKNSVLNIKVNDKIPPFFIHWVYRIFIHMYQFHYNWNINQGKGETMEIFFQHHAHFRVRGVWSVKSKTARLGLCDNY